MSGIAILVVSIVVLALGYVFYGGWLAKQWGVDPSRKTPAYEMEDGVDYVPAKAPVLLGHHFASIAGAGPINGPIQAALFGWVPVLLWILIGGVFIGAVQDFSALFVSVRNKGMSIGEVMEVHLNHKSKVMFSVFTWLVMLLVDAAFADIVAKTFYYVEGSTNNGSVATASLLFIPLAIAFGFLVYRRGVPLGISTVVGVALLCGCVAAGLAFPLNYGSINFWRVVVFVYCGIASVTPVWILLQPRDYLNSFLLYFMIAAAVIGILGSNPTVILTPFNGFTVGNSMLFPTLFITVACGAVSGFHSLVGSGTTSKQLDQEKDAKPIAYGGMLIECALALISVCAVGYIWNQYADGTTTTPTVVFATGLASMFSKVFGDGCYNAVYSMLILAVSAFCLTSVDTATRLARYMFAEFFVEPGKTREDLTGWKRVITNPYVATGITVVAGVALGLTGYAKIWALFGAANQLLAALGLLAVCCWLGKVGRNNKMFYFPMFFMLIVTLTSLVFTIKAQVVGIIAGGEGVVWCYVRGIIGVLLVILAIDLVVEGIRALGRNKKTAQAAE